MEKGGKGRRQVSLVNNVSKVKEAKVRMALCALVEGGVVCKDAVGQVYG